MLALLLRTDEGGSAVVSAFGMDDGNSIVQKLCRTCSERCRRLKDVPFRKGREPTQHSYESSYTSVYAHEFLPASIYSRKRIRYIPQRKGMGNHLVSQDLIGRGQGNLGAPLTGDITLLVANIAK